MPIFTSVIMMLIRFHVRLGREILTSKRDQPAIAGYTTVHRGTMYNTGLKVKDQGKRVRRR